MVAAADSLQTIAAMSDKCVHQRPLRVPGRRVDDHPRGFVEDDQIVVLEDDSQRDILASRLGIDRLGYFQQEPVTGFDPV